MRTPILVLAFLLGTLLAGCGTTPSPALPAVVSSSVSESSSTPALPQSTPEPKTVNYCASVADEVLAGIITPQMSPPEQILAAYEFIIENTFFAEPVGLELWRVRGGEMPNYVENRALSPLLFGVGYCEDYAAALTLLLHRLGFEAEYLPGLTISVDGGFVDHAWVVVKLDGTWYHLDPQLEQNVMNNNTITYRYLLKSDENMLADHRWGENLLLYGGLDERQQQEVREHYLAHPCPRNYYIQSPLPKKLSSVPRPNHAALADEVAAELLRYEEEHGKLPPLELDILPPVFGYEGYRETKS